MAAKCALQVQGSDRTVRTEAEVKKRLKYYERRWKQSAKKNGGVLWWAIKYSAEKEWADWFLRRKPAGTKAGERGGSEGVRHGITKL